MAIKGHMTIELADAKTGKVVEKHEDDNLVTNGVKHYMKNMGMLNTTPFSVGSGGIFATHQSNLAIPLFGGLMLFDTAQTENAEHIFVSGGTKMTGNGINGYTSNDSVTEFGSYNSAESGWQEDGSFKQVWDFTTTQANGTIACACLCPYNYAAHGEGNSSSKVQKTSNSGMSASANTWWSYNGTPVSKQLVSRPDQLFGTGFEAYPIKIDIENNYAILLGYNSGVSPCLFKAVKVAFPWSKLDIRDGYNNGGRLLSAVQDIGLPTQVTSLANRWVTRPHDFLGRDSNGAFYVAIKTAGYGSYYFSASQSVVIVKFVVGNDDTVTCEYVMTLAPSVISETTGNWYYNSPNCMQVVGDSLFLATSTFYNALDKTKWFKINLGTQVVERVTDNTISTFASFAGVGNRFVIPDSDSFYSYNGGVNIAKVDLTAKEVASLNGWEGVQYSSFYGLVDGKTAFLYSNGETGSTALTAQIYRWMHFLSTINNLQSPVTKTSDKTMKVTYVLRFDAEE